MLTVGDRYGPMLRHVEGTADEDDAVRLGGDGTSSGRRVRLVLGDHLPRWQAAPAARQVTERITRPGEGISPEIKTAGDQLGA